MSPWACGGDLPQSHQEMKSLSQVGDFSSFFFFFSARLLARTGNEPSGPPYTHRQVQGEVASFVHPSIELIDLSPR